jgi:glycosyltransferase involved in cell wall biosynthesis
VPGPVPSVSILIPCFNARQWVGAAIESALGQTCGNLEVIVIDDGSTDGSQEAIQAFGDSVKPVYRENRGGNPTRNELLAMATGEWVQFLDADDYLLSDKIFVQLHSLREAGNAADVIYSPVIGEEWRHGQIVHQKAGEIDPSASLPEKWIRWQVAQTGSVLWRRKALLAIGGWNEQYPCCQDNEVTLRAIQRGLKFHFCPDAGAVYRIWSEGTVCRKDPTRVIRYKTQLIEQMMDWLEEQGKVTPAIEAAAGQAFFEMARTWAKYDLEAAVDYQRQRRWYLPIGPAAPVIYRITHKMLGFRQAEQLARRRKPLR